MIWAGPGDNLERSKIKSESSIKQASSQHHSRQPHPASAGLRCREQHALKAPITRTEFKYKRPDIRHPHSSVANFKGENIVWWYSFIRNNRQGERSIPEVEVIFKTLYGDVPGSITSAIIPLAALPHYQLGSVWSDGECVSDTGMAQEEFNVNFSPKGYGITSRNELRKTGQGHIFHDAEYELPLRCWSSKLINFRLPDNKNLLVPCTEYFVRAYAHNMIICRSICTLLFDEVLSALFECKTPDAYRWLIKPKRNIPDSEAVFLAHLLYDNFTHNEVRRLNSNFTSSAPGGKVFPEVRPWFEGRGKLLCRGRWINEGNTFLCLDLCKSSNPAGPRIELFRDEFDNTNGEAGGRTIIPQPTRLPKDGEPVNEESHVPPDAQAEKIVVNLRPFGTLGPERNVKILKYINQTKRGWRGPGPSKADTFSSGDGTGTGKNVGKSEHVSDVALESHGFLLDIWNAFLSIKRDNPKQFKDLSWHASNGFGVSSPPIINLFDPNGLSKGARNWIHLYRSINWDDKRCRGLMVLRLIIDNQTFYCFEIERQEASDQVHDPRGYSGVLFRAHTIDPEAFKNFVKSVMTKIIKNKGVFKGMMDQFPEDALLITHHIKDPYVRYRTALLKTLAQAGIDFTETV